MQNADLIVWGVGGVIIVGLLLLNIFADLRRKRKPKDDEPVEAEYEEIAEPPADESPCIGNLRVSALQEMVRHSVRLNLAALEAQREMNDLAYHYRQDASTPRNTDFQPEIVSVEFRPPENWPRGQF